MGGDRPAYLDAARSGRLKEIVETAYEKLRDCTLCPRRCRVDRLAGETGFCRTGEQAIVASWDAHFGEEAPLVGRRGSGTIFFTHCNLGCIFCQNYDISHGGYGRAVSSEDLADIMLTLQSNGCHNINFVTPSHVVPQILDAVSIAADKGLRLPLVFNTGGYDRVRTLALLEGIIDIYMPDFKFWDKDVADQTCGAPDYPDVARRAVKEMHRQVGDLTLDEAGIARRGLLVRHLVMPGGLAGTGNVMAYIAEHVSKDTYVNIMAQYRPCGRAHEIEVLGTPLSKSDYREALRAAEKSGIHRIDTPRRVFMLG